MAGSVVLTPTNVPVVPGTTGTCSVRIRNTGVVVDQFSISVLGQPAAWTTAVPAVLSLFPGAEGTIELHFAPPRTAEVGSGPTPFGVRVDASQDPDGSVVEEGEVDLLAYTDLRAKITPRTSEAKRKARHEVLLDNRGNTAVDADLSASDPDEVLAFELSPRTVRVPAGGTSRVAVNVAAREGFLKGPDKQRPFQVRVLAGDQPAVNLDAALVQKAGMPKFILPLAAAAVAVVLVAVMLPALKKEPGSGKLSLTSDEAATTTTAAPAATPADDGPDEGGPATAEEAAAAAEAERAANGKDPGAPTGGGSGGSGGGTEAASSDTTVAAPPPKGTNTATETEAPPVTAVPAPPPSTTTVPGASTTTTAPQDVDMYYVIKQENDKQAHYHYIGDGTVGQTFKANGPFITEAWLNLSGGKVAFNIRKGGPGGAIVGSSPTVAIVQFGWTKVTFPKIPVSVGGTYYLEGVVSGSAYAWFSNTNDYADGDGFINGGAHGHDLNARVIGRTG